MNLSVVLQGPIYSWTPSFIKKFKEFSFVKEVVLSTWEGDNVSNCEADYIIQSVKPAFAGKGNRNLQIVSSFAGVMRANCALVLKCRTDMFLPHLNKMMKEFEIQDSIYALSVYPRFPFHPRDHVFLGKSENLIDLFNIPCDTAMGTYKENSDVRSESYVGSHYYAKRDYRVNEFVENPLEFLTDVSPKRNRALAVYHELIRKNECFVPFSKIPIEWPKYYPNGYPFAHLKQVYGELYGDEIFQ